MNTSFSTLITSTFAASAVLVVGEGHGKPFDNLLIYCINKDS